MTTAAERWRDELAAWAVDPEILAAAPESPYGCPPELFPADPNPPETPSQQRAREALPADGSVLDVGCGTGAAAFALVPPAARVVGVDQSAVMLAEFTAVAAERGVAAQTVEGRWPDVADRVPHADVVVCHNVAYNVPDLPAFVRALDAHARRRVVLELPPSHPWRRMAGMWRHFHGQDRPDGPTVELAIEVLREAGLAPHAERFTRPARDLPFDRRVAFTRRRLCLPYDREPEVAEMLRSRGGDEPWEAVTLWWDVPTG